MTDWDKINREKQKNICLCEARNAAVLLMRNVPLADTSWNIKYKDIVKKLFNLNIELNNELIQKKGGNNV